MIKDIYYKNGKGLKLNLLEPPYLLQTGELFNTKWNYESIRKAYGGASITEFWKDLEERKLILSIVNYGKESYESAVDRFYDVTNYDVTNQVPGRLYYGNMYLSCYLVQSLKTEWESDSSYLDNEVTLVAEYPVWIQDKFYQFRKKEDTESSNNMYLDYPYDHPFDYMGEIKGVGYIDNPDYPCHFQAIVYGPVPSPRFTISDHLYEVSTKLGEGEYMIIDSRLKTVVRVRTDGTKVNEFNNRNKQFSLFEKIPVGNNLISWSGNFGIDMTLFYERGEPIRS